MEILPVLVALVQIQDVAGESHWEFRSWATYPTEAWVLLAGMAVCLIAMLRITIRHRIARRRRINRWNQPIR